MRTSIDIVNYFKRSARRKELRRQIRVFDTQIGFYCNQINDLQHEVRCQKDWHTLYSELIERLQNVPKYCALKDPKQITVAYPLERFVTFEMTTCVPSRNPVLQQSHAENMYYAEMIIHDYIVNDLIHFRIKTAEGVYAYQYSKKGVAIQPFKTILKEVTWLIARAWYDKLHLKKGE